MDGLEISEITISNLISNNEEKRIDSEYFRKDYLHLYKKLDRCDVLGDIADMHDVSSNGSFECVHNILNDNYQKVIPYIRSGDVGETFLDSEERMVKISREAHNALPLSQTILHDVIMARKGKIGGATIITENEVGFNCNENVIKLTIKDKKYNPYYVTTFFNSSYGKKQVERLSTGNVQPWVSIYQIKKLKCYYLSDDFQLAVESLLRKAHQIVLDSKHAYEKAKKLLEKFISISNASSEKIIYSKKNYSQIFNGSGRLDAEYYQPKYEQYKDIIQNSKLGFTFVKTEFELISEKCDRILSQYPYIEIGDINVATGAATFNIVSTEDLPDNAKIMTKVNDILVSTVRPNRGAVAILEQDDLLVSGAFTVLREKSDYPKEVLQVLLRSEMYRDWMLRYNVGTSYPVIKDNDILNLPIPILDEELKKEIVNSVQESSKLRKKSKELLDIAIKAVEMAIETDEQTALSWLEAQNL